MLFENTILKELKVLYKLDNYHGILLYYGIIYKLF